MDWLAGSRLHLVDIVVTRGSRSCRSTCSASRRRRVYAYLVFVSFHAVFIHANVRFRFGCSTGCWSRRASTTGTTRRARAVDKNFAVHLPWIDRLFGTAYLPPGRWPDATGSRGARCPRDTGASSSGRFAASSTHRVREGDHAEQLELESDGRHSAAALLAAVAAPLAVHAQDWKPTPPERRCPSRWGATDERGAANHMGSETVMRATRLIKEGKIYELGRVLDSGIPLFGIRSLHLHTARSSGPSGVNDLRGNEETVVTQLGQFGTQFDGVTPHRDRRAPLQLPEDRGGRDPIRFHEARRGEVGALFTRGVLLDVAAAKGVPMLDAGYEITVADLEGTLQRQNVKIAAGDAVFLHTGWGKLWGKDNAKYNSGQPGPNACAAEWLAKLSPMLVGADNWGIEVRPNPNKDLVFPVHQIMITINGIFLLENMDLEARARDRVHEFAFIIQPLKLKGGTGSTVAPIAVK